MYSSNRELVIDFVSYKLSQKGYSWSQLEEEDENRTDFAGEEDEMDGVLNGSPSWHAATSHIVNGASVHQSSLEVHEIRRAANVRQALREAGDEFELRYRRAFSDLTSQLHITPSTAYQSFEQVVNELFRDGVNWGRIVAFFSFGGALCVESVVKEMRVLVKRIVSWMTTYLTDHLDPWIQENGGWLLSVMSFRLLILLLSDAGAVSLEHCPGSLSASAAVGCPSTAERARFVDLYGNDAAAEVRKGQETFNKWLLTGATVAGVLLLGSLLSRK
ncbi:bcl-2-like protein 1 isoform X1 [Motacilla alba alba]|uniref:bcl-2-like protein 1 isoform X1 n=1 Tax=Motacilla alba alba TaxID=1094192 RepID=UPI0018D56E2E|nr:bcl-2-like protein 1 isoform X1 [Motacilla alba alba]XP_038014563.1 bcl-2-like protein 1 isoform X1 [Motacilla alba alba]XP_038014564.1 bcl-2-like protein 1 isoform X1 [Motacilla alba alba]XP_038014566.1 bcl-2-like protein 1 isoform X1 [Motacilla alba alba]XP_038014567.1 bcl-2-like protein 1 isoform X1 [Motacilla alba alba]XP_038014568.1 bcl-2-like protein 1 isoform X1 [Motacilla alba alba]